MKILLDENMDVEFCDLLPEHEVRTVSGQGWSSFSNGDLLRLADQHDFEAFLTADKNT